MKCKSCDRNACDSCGHCPCGWAYWEDLWISVEDQLPDDDNSVLTISEGYFQCVGYHTRKGWFYYPNDQEWNDNSLIDVTHWMPLPKPPEE